METRHPEWRDNLEYTKYPFSNTATLSNATGDVLFETTFLDASFYIVGANENIYISKILITNDAVTLYVGDSLNSTLVSTTFYKNSIPDNLVFKDLYNRYAGVLVSTAERLSIFAAWNTGEHLFTVNDTNFVARCCNSIPDIGIRGFILDDGNIVSGDTWLIGDDGVALTCETAQEKIPGSSALKDITKIRVDIVGDPLFRRRLCSVPTAFATPKFIETITFCTPGFVGSSSIDEYISSSYSSTVSVDGVDAVDILFFQDTTGSMGSLINTIKSLFSPIAQEITDEFPTISFKWGAAEYRDLSDGHPFDEHGYRVNQQLTTNINAVETAMNSWSAYGGGDWPEGHMRAFTYLDDNWTNTDINTGGLAGRSNILRIVVWGGDAYGTLNLPGYPSSLATVINQLKAAGIVVIGINTWIEGTGLDEFGQATEITSQTGGGILHEATLLSTEDIKTKIKALLSTAISGGTVGTGVDKVDVTTWEPTETRCVKCGPGDFGDIKIFVHDAAASDTILRIRAIPEGLKIETVGERLENL